MQNRCFRIDVHLNTIYKTLSFSADVLYQQRFPLSSGDFSYKCRIIQCFPLLFISLKQFEIEKIHTDFAVASFFLNDFRIYRSRINKKILTNFIQIFCWSIQWSWVFHNLVELESPPHNIIVALIPHENAEVSSDTQLYWSSKNIT